MRRPYGLTDDELEAAHFDVALALETRCADALKPLTEEQKRHEWRILFMDQVEKHQKDLKLWLDGERIWLGWYRTDGSGVRSIIIRALVQLKTQTLVAVPLRKESIEVAWDRPWMAQQVYDRVIKTYRLIIPSGTF